MTQITLQLPQHLVRLRMGKGQPDQRGPGSGVFLCPSNSSEQRPQSKHILTSNPLNGSWFYLFHLAQVRCDLTFIFPYASFWSVWVFYFIFTTPKWFFSFCHSESSYIHSTEREFPNLECNIEKSILEGRLLLFCESDIVSYPDQSHIYLPT